MPKYENSVIYKIKHNEDYDDKDCYIGSTSNFKNRKNQHKYSCNNEILKNNIHVYQFIRNNGGWNAWVMIPIEQYSCNDKKELLIRERHHIDLLQPTLNKHLPTRNQKEWNDDNKEKINEYWKNNYVKRYEKNKKYRESHKEKINEYNKEKIICDHCECKITRNNLATHKKTKKCINFVKKN